MSQMEAYDRGRRDGIRWAITWLHARARDVNDPKAHGILNSAAFAMGRDTSKKVQSKRTEPGVDSP